MLAGRVAVITGAATGLGAALVEVFERHGAAVVGIDLEGDGLLHGDVGTEAGNRMVVEEAVRRHGRLDILVLNAGLHRVAPVAALPEDQWDLLMGVMAKGPYLAIQAAWPHLTREPGGRIVVTAGNLSFMAEPGRAAYVAAKHAVLGLVRTVALEGGPFGLTCNAVAPHWMRTARVEAELEEQMRLHGWSREEATARKLRRQPVKEFVEPAEVAEVMAFLASPAASGISGACVPVDRGLLVS
jgi:3-hydroxybutyrate dehydrogenase